MSPPSFMNAIQNECKYDFSGLPRPILGTFAMRSLTFSLPCCVSGVGVVSFYQFPGRHTFGWVWTMEGAGRMGRQRKAMTCTAFLSRGASAGGSSLFRLVYKILTSTQGPIFLFLAKKPTVSVQQQIS